MATYFFFAIHWIQFDKRASTSQLRQTGWPLSNSFEVGKYLRRSFQTLADTNRRRDVSKHKLSENYDTKWTAIKKAFVVVEKMLKCEQNKFKVGKFIN